MTSPLVRETEGPRTSRCRVCLECADEGSLFVEGRDSRLSQCTGLPVLNDDSLPSGLCADCLASLDGYCRFKTLAERSIALLLYKRLRAKNLNEKQVHRDRTRSISSNIIDVSNTEKLRELFVLTKRWNRKKSDTVNKLFKKLIMDKECNVILNDIVIKKLQHPVESDDDADFTDITGVSIEDFDRDLIPANIKIDEKYIHESRPEDMVNEEYLVLYDEDLQNIQNVNTDDLIHITKNEPIKVDSYEFINVDISSVEECPSNYYTVTEDFDVFEGASSKNVKDEFIDDPNIQIIEIDELMDESLGNQCVISEGNKLIYQDNIQNVGGQHICPHCGILIDNMIEHVCLFQEKQESNIYFTETQGEAVETSQINQQIVIQNIEIPIHDILQTDSVTSQKLKRICPICGILTFNIGAHLANHRDPQDFFCKLCNKNFKHKCHFDVHMKRHSGIKDNVCEICGSSYYFSKSLKRHKLTHKGIKPYECHKCPMKFYVKCDLMRHLSIHDGIKRYACTKCSMAFNAKHQLICHNRMHTGEKPYTCEICDVAFTYKANLNNHCLRLHHVDIKFKSIHKITRKVLNDLLSEPKTTTIAPPVRKKRNILRSNYRSQILIQKVKTSDIS